MKLCILLPSLELGGTERRMVMLAEQLKNKEHDVEICTLRESGVFVQQVQQLGIPLHTLAKKGRYDLFAPFLRLLNYFKTKKFDVVLSCLPSANLYALTAKIAAPNKPLIWGLASAELPMGDYGLWARLSYYAQMIVSRFVDKIVVNSFAGRKAAVNKGYDKERIQVIHNGVDTNKFTYSEQKRMVWRKQHAIPSTAPLIGIVGRLDPAKGHGVFLDACLLAHQKNKQVWFAIVGGGEGHYAERLISKIKQHPLSGKRLVHIMHESDVAAAYSAFDVATITSKSESLPNALMEALACERLSVVTDVGDCKYVLSSFGEVCEAGDAKAIAKSWLSVLGRVREPSAFNELSAYEEPSTLKKSLADEESLTNEQSLTDEKPLANKKFLKENKELSALQRYINKNFSVNKMAEQFEVLCVSLINNAGRRKSE